MLSLALDEDFWGCVGALPPGHKVRARLCSGMEIREVQQRGAGLQRVGPGRPRSPGLGSLVLLLVTSPDMINQTVYTWR